MTAHFSSNRPPFLLSFQGKHPQAFPFSELKQFGLHFKKALPIWEEDRICPLDLKKIVISFFCFQQNFTPGRSFPIKKTFDHHKNFCQWQTKAFSQKEKKIRRISSPLYSWTHFLLCESYECAFDVVLLSWHYPRESWMLYRRYTDHAG